jgi:hypothetical protein
MLENNVKMSPFEIPFSDFGFTEFVEVMKKKIGWKIDLCYICYIVLLLLKVERRKMLKKETFCIFVKEFQILN